MGPKLVLLMEFYHDSFVLEFSDAVSKYDVLWIMCYFVGVYKIHSGKITLLAWRHYKI